MSVTIPFAMRVQHAQTLSAPIIAVVMQDFLEMVELPVLVSRSAFLDVQYLHWVVHLHR